MLIRQIRLKVTLRLTVTELNPYFFFVLLSVVFPFLFVFGQNQNLDIASFLRFFYCCFFFVCFFSILVPFLFALVKTNMTLPPFFFVFFVFALLLVVF